MHQRTHSTKSAHRAAQLSDAHLDARSSKQKAHTAQHAAELPPLRDRREDVAERSQPAAEARAAPQVPAEASGRESNASREERRRQAEAEKHYAQGYTARKAVRTLRCVQLCIWRMGACTRLHVARFGSCRGRQRLHSISDCTAYASYEVGDASAVQSLPAAPSHDHLQPVKSF
jgi:hypothetical protein